MVSACSKTLSQNGPENAVFGAVSVGKISIRKTVGFRKEEYYGWGRVSTTFGYMQPLTQKQLLALLLLAGLNIVLDTYMGGYDPRFGLEVIRTPEMVWTRRRLFLLDIPLLSLVVGTVAALVPFNRQPYGQRLVTGALWLALGLEGACLLRALLRAVAYFA